MCSNTVLSLCRPVDSGFTSVNPDVKPDGCQRWSWCRWRPGPKRAFTVGKLLKVWFVIKEFRWMDSFMSLCRIARCRRIITVYHARTLCPGVAKFCTGMSRLATHVHGGAMVLSRSDTVGSSWLTVDNPGQLEHGLSISPTPPSIKPSSTM